MPAAARALRGGIPRSAERGSRFAGRLIACVEHLPVRPGQAATRQRKPATGSFVAGVWTVATVHFSFAKEKQKGGDDPWRFTILKRRS